MTSSEKIQLEELILKCEKELFEREGVVSAWVPDAREVEMAINRPWREIELPKKRKITNSTTAEFKAFRDRTLPTIMPWNVHEAHQRAESLRQRISELKRRLSPAVETCLHPPKDRHGATWKAIDQEFKGVKSQKLTPQRLANIQAVLEKDGAPVQPETIKRKFADWKKSRRASTAR
jgi:hypothetical protein